MTDLIFILFLFALGACIGSFLNVVVWRLPREQSLISPGSRCPKCLHALAWRDNIPVFGWMMLKGKCRYCQASISARYPIIEFITGLLFAGWYVLFFILDLGPAASPQNLYIERDWPIFGLYLFVLAVLLAASLIDAELFIIPLELTWLLAAVGVVVHTIIDRPRLPGALLASPLAGAMAVGALLGWLVSLYLLKKKIIPRSFDEINPLMEHQKEKLAKEGTPKSDFPVFTKSQIRGEIRKEMLFLLPPLTLAAGLGLLTLIPGPLQRVWEDLLRQYWLAGALGSIFGGMIGAFVVWITRILGTIGFGREAMGLGDVHLMFGVGACIGAGPSTIAFFLAPFGGMIIALYMLIFSKRREVPYGPYLSLGTAFVMLFQCPIEAYLMPGIEGLRFMLFGCL